MRHQVFVDPALARCRDRLRQGDGLDCGGFGNCGKLGLGLERVIGKHEGENDGNGGDEAAADNP
jgi:hypothetical protein